MYILSRMLLMLAMALFAYCLLLAVILAVGQLPQQDRAMAWIVLAIVAIAVIAFRRRRRLLTAFGTAVWASNGALERAGMLRARKGLILGRVPDDGTWPLGRAVKALLNPRLASKDACRAFWHAMNRRQRKQGRLVTLPQAVHTAVFAPTGVGKGVSCIIPFLMTCEESCVVVDFKGENALLTAERRRRMGHNIVILDPFKVVTPKLKRRTDTFNPLDFIDKDSPLALDECRDMAEALIIRTGEEKEPHWTDSAEAIIASVIATVVQYGPRENGQRSLQAVRDILAHPQKFDIAKRLMLEHGGMLARWGGQMEHFKGDELSSVLTTSNRFLRFLDTLAIAENTVSSSFDPAKLRGGKTTIYLVLPPEHMRAQSPLLRIWIGSMFRACLRGGLQERNKVHFILDEAAVLGYMPALDDAVDKYRGYGVRLQFYYQSLGQLKKCWPSDQGQTLLSNSSKIFFGTNDIQTAQYLSQALGNETILVDSGGDNRGWSRGSSSTPGKFFAWSFTSSTSGGKNRSWQQQTRELLKPDEVMQLDPRIAITLTPDARPLWTTLLRYYEEKALFRQRHWWMRLTAACWTFLVSAALLVSAAASAMVFTIGLLVAIEQEQQRMAPAIYYQLPPQYIRPPPPRKG